MKGVCVHATAIVLGADGAVLLLGESGAGKSDVALRLIALGARLVSDDQTLLFVKEGRLFAEAPEALRGRLEIRGVGIVELPAAGPAPLVLAVRLDAKAAIPRLPGPGTYALPAALGAVSGPPLLVLAPFEAATPAKIAAAVNALIHGTFVAGLREAAR